MSTITITTPSTRSSPGLSRLPMRCAIGRPGNRLGRDARAGHVARLGTRLRKDCVSCSRRVVPSSQRARNENRSLIRVRQRGIDDMELPTSTVDGMRIFDDGPGAGERDFCYLLLHGLGNSLDFWTAVAPIISEAHRTVAVDLPGFGLSRVPSRGFTLAEVAADVVRAVRSRGIDRCVVVGHSLGGIVALQLAGADSSLVREIILVDAMLLDALTVLRSPVRAMRQPVLAASVIGQFVGSSIPLNRRRAFALSKTPLFRTVALWPFISRATELDNELFASALAHNNGTSSLRALGMASGINLEVLMRNARQPTDLVWGKDDHLISVCDVARTRRLMNVRREYEIAGCGHWPMIEKPDVLTDFLLDATGGENGGGTGKSV